MFLPHWVHTSCKVRIGKLGVGAWVSKMTTFSIFDGWGNADPIHRQWEIEKKTDFRKEAIALTLAILDLLSAQHGAKYNQEKVKKQNCKKHVQIQEAHSRLG